MSGQPRHSPEGMIKRLMMTKRWRLLVFVEGRELDSPFYEDLLTAAFGDAPTSFDILTADIVKGARGKQGLLQLHDLLAASGALDQTNNSGMISALFMLDRDFDPHLGRARASKHLVYTQLYNVEAEIFHNADAADALHYLLSVTRATAHTISSDLGDWVTELCERWADWLHLCLLSVALNARCGIKPKVLPEGWPVDPPSGREIARMRKEVLGAAECTDAEKTAKRIDQLFGELREDRHELVRLINGKHLARYLEDFLKKHPRVAEAHRKGLGASASRVFLRSLDFQSEWAKGFHEAVAPFAGRG